MTAIPMRAHTTISAAALLGGAGLTLLITLDALTTALAVLSLIAGTVLVRQFGLRLALWYGFLLTIPIREPLSIDIVGTKTLYLNDLLLIPLAAASVFKHGIRGIWRESGTFKIGCAIVALTTFGLYTAARWTWTLSFIQETVWQLATFHVAWHLIRDARRAQISIMAFVAGMIPAALYGFYQSSLSVEEYRAQNWTIPALSWDAQGVPHIRIYSTFWHQLALSIALSTSVGYCLGLLYSVRNAAHRFFLIALAAMFVACNQFTYSMGGLVGTGTAAFAALALNRRRWILVLFPLVIIGWTLVTPTALVKRIEGVFTGEHTSLAARLIVYTQALQVLEEHPIFGVGWGSIRHAFEGEYRISRDIVVSFAAENYFLQRAVAMGGVGLILVFWACILFFRNAWTRPPPGMEDWPRAALLVGGAAFYLQGQTYPTDDPFSRFVLWMMFALAERMRIAFREAA